MKKEKSKRRLFPWILSGICILLIAVVAAWQWQAVEVVILGLLYSEEQRTQMVEEKEAVVQSMLEEIPEVDVTPLPKEADRLIAEGVISEEEAMRIATKDTTLDVLMEEKGVAFGEDSRGKTIILVKDETGNYVRYKDESQLPQTEKKPQEEGSVIEDASSAEEAVNPGSPVQEVGPQKPMEPIGPQKPVQKDTPSKQSAELQGLIAKIYVLRSTYIGRLDALVAQAKKEYYQDKKRKSELQGKYLRIGSSMEQECDAQMEAIISQIHAELIRTGGDLSLIDEIRAVYAQEKSAKKAALFSQYAK